MAGEADTKRDVRGFAIKFYTKERNWDLVGNNAAWDFWTLCLESLHQVTILMNNRGIPASYHDSINCAKMLLQKGALVDERNDRKQTPLAGVCFKGHLEMAELLLAFGANPNANNGLGATPYTFAILFGRQEIAELLIKYSQVSFFKRIPLAILRLIKKA